MMTPADHLQSLKKKCRKEKTPTHTRMTASIMAANYTQINENESAYNTVISFIAF